MKIESMEITLRRVDDICNKYFEVKLAK